MISIIIPVYNLLETTKKAVEAVGRNTDLPYEIIISDDGSEEDYATWSEKLGLKYVRNLHKGFASTCNRGSEHAEGDILVFLNNDTVVQSGWLRPLVEAVENRYAVSGPMLLYPGGFIQHCGMVIGWDIKGIRPRLIYEGYPSNFPPAHKKRSFRILTGACLAVRREVWKEVGGFSEDYVNGLEDVDFCLRVWEKGYSLLYCPESKVIHFCGMTPGRFSYEDQNMKIFLSKWRGKVSPDEWRYYFSDLPHSFGWMAKVAMGSFLPLSLRKVYWKVKRRAIRR